MVAEPKTCQLHQALEDSGVKHSLSQLPPLLEIYLTSPICPLKVESHEFPLFLPSDSSVPQVRSQAALLVYRLGNEFNRPLLLPELVPATLQVLKELIAAQDYTKAEALLSCPYLIVQRLII